ncbi:uncharacterized protein LOC125719910 isoform X3 [Brienomyrus brachyistius]|uniref:uncharacterized protein LOC125719910 isoform X3 n=1 Tax=Brienomyrus brachyistius TaxID=42636 RepID=UPI0020B1CA52|nr:uncharacterized protein LOC125719910 isoform X3 [Brienomyrus brachyistius]
MKFPVGVSLLLVSVTHAATCGLRRRQPVVRYVAEGKPLLLHVNVDFSIRRWNLVKDNVVIAKDSPKETPWTLLNKILKKNKVFKNDSGIYSLNVYAVKIWHSIKIQLNVEAGDLRLSSSAPVWNVTLSQLCLPHREMRVTCSSQGDAKEFSWTLGNQKLDRTVSSLVYQDNSIILKENVQGNLTCSVRNHVSHGTVTRELIPCPGLGERLTCRFHEGTEVLVRRNSSESQPALSNVEILVSFDKEETLAIVCYSHHPHHIQYLWDLGIVLLLFSVLVGLQCLCSKVKRSGTTDVKMEDELIYAQVRIHEKKSNQRKKTVTPDAWTVEYGAVAVPELSDEMGATLYSVVQASDQLMPQQPLEENRDFQNLR